MGLAPNPLLEPEKIPDKKSIKSTHFTRFGVTEELRAPAVPQFPYL